MTAIYGMTDGGRKRTGRSQDVVPRLVVYDPELTLTLPATVAGPSAMNAMAHAIAALYEPGANPVTALLADEAIGALARGLPGAAGRPGRPGGQDHHAVGRVPGSVGPRGVRDLAASRICHVLGGAYDLPHAAMNAAGIRAACWGSRPARSMHSWCASAHG